MTDPDNNSGLVSDCEALLAARDTLAGSASLNWTADTPIAQWDGVTVRGTPQRVTRLDIRQKGLDGTIPGELGLLSNLTILNLRTNRLTGTIPAELGNLTGLERLLLHDNRLTGPIPDLSGLSNLKMLWLSGKEMSLTGSLPAWLNTMSGLESLSLWGNELSGPIPDLTGMTNLKLLKIQSNNLDGGVPAWLGDMSDTLRGLYLHLNPLGGTIPPELGKLTRLSRLWLHSSGLTGPIPVELGEMERLRGLNLRDNSLTGPIPSELGGLSNMQKLRLHNNDLAGSIPAELGSLSNLTDLWLSGNGLSGSIPSQLGMLDNLKQLSVKDNNLSGDIPAELGDLGDTLTHLFLAGNSGLTGCVPAGLAAVRSNDLDNLELRVCGEEVIPPDLAIDSVIIGDLSSIGGTSFTLSAQVRNQGDESSGPTTLRYYRSIDATITGLDTEVGTDSVLALDPSENSVGSISLTAPTSVGSYYYGACVDTVPKEINPENNCSDAVAVTVVYASISDLIDDLPWVKDGVTENERRATVYIREFALIDPLIAERVARMPWLADGVADIELEMLGRLLDIANADPQTAVAVTTVPDDTGRLTST